MDSLPRASSAAASAASPQEQRNPWEELLQGLDAIVWEADPETLHFSFVSEHAEQLLGYPVADWLSEPDFWARHIHPDDRELTLPACHEAAARGEDHKLDFRFIAADGRVVWLCNIVKVDPDERGTPRKLRGVMIDITGQREAEQALRESEERYRTLVETAGDLILSFDTDGHVTYANPAVREVLGLTPDEMLGRHFAELIAPEDISGAVEQFREVMRGGRAIGRAVRALAKDGREVVLRCNAGPLRDAEGRTVGITCTGGDITEARQREQELSEARLRNHGSGPRVAGPTPPAHPCAGSAARPPRDPPTVSSDRAGTAHRLDPLDG